MFQTTSSKVSTVRKNATLDSHYEGGNASFKECFSLQPVKIFFFEGYG